ncbi:dihydrolipoamide acetyltransferase family protein [Brevibacterium daeguense]|uniref:Dihydrolipoamide acetyltransferase component of pyruvate dehydrogenase complex n=1 Tax=Brevibacterium daeguense TaxID=909936 RepID=A0ABP8EFK9_9MICO|nr:dihydrolipoamide acetyltransferase family protein [Brevibacterium daeguense]
MSSTFAYRLPDVGEGLDEAEIISWKVEVGSPVVPDQVLAEVETDKSVVEVPSPVTGTITSLAGDPGDIIEVGATFVEIALTDGAPGARADSDHGGPAGGGAANAGPAGQGEKPEAEQAPAAAPASASGDDRPQRVLASPATRKLALELGVDLQTVPGSGPAGRVTKEDVESAARGETSTAESPAPAEPAPAAPRVAAASREDEVVPLRGLRRQIAKNMVESWQQVPHITDFREVDATKLVAARAAVNEHLQSTGRAEKITYLPFLVRAVSIALARCPKFNASLDMGNEQITYFGSRGIGLAVSTDAGLFVPVLKDSESMSLVQISRAAQELADKARERSITSQEMSGGTFTITNFGSYGGWLGTPIIRPPESAIAGFGRIADRVVPVDGVPAVRPILPLAVSADHRLIDGADMGQFLALLTTLLEDPVRMMAEEF